MPKKNFASLLVGYFFNRKRAVVWFLLLFIIIAYLINIKLALALNEWNGRFYDSLQIVDKSSIYAALKDFVVLCSAIITVLVMADYVEKRLALLIRRDITHLFLDDWLSLRSTHFLLKETGKEPDNPDQRIAEDIRELVNLSLSLGLSLFNSLLTIGSFSIVLWNLSGSISIFNYKIPGYMFWVCLIYTFIENLLAHFIGRPLKSLNYEGQKREADFRATLLEKRQFSDAIAGAHGEFADSTQIKEKFANLMQVLVHYIKKRRDLDFFSVGVGQITHLTPIFFSLPSLFSGAIQLGGLMQIRGAFIDVARSLSWIAMSYPELARFFATYERLDQLQKNFSEADVRFLQMQERHQMSLTELSAQVCFNVPNKGVAKVDFRVAAKQLGVLFGRSGSGKSTLLRILAGFHLNYDGNVAFPGKVFWVPQKGYLLQASLRTNLAYPLTIDTLTDEKAKELLHKVGLIHLEAELDDDRDWRYRLSGGEQQRILLARAINLRPDILLLDETISALDKVAALDILQALKKWLPESTILLVTHQQEIIDFADVKLNMENFYSEHCA